MIGPAKSVACALLASLACSAGTLKDVAVICVGADGRSVVEIPAPALPGSGGAREASEASTDLDGCACFDGCGPCTDRPLGGEDFYLRAKSEEPEDLQSFGLAVLSLSLCAAEVLRPLDPVSPPRTPSFIPTPQRETIVLLI